ncbi:hypothetical protein L596_020624 [Steinernema carpocapsae]|uniref:G-protein coupled receptors family 1 profile domain-containing protein n=1 Tax=Steinernema carpocapsae TaxID=34508 RepID=A0A4U5MUA2_STECR|nr:hypothetical protein L596_020624 [Steinernema carpocapsae]
MLPICSPTGDPLSNDVPVPYTIRGLLIGISYLIGYVVTAGPQLLVLFAILHKHHLQYSCYKLMIMVSFYDILNLTEAMFISGIFSVFNWSHCNLGYPVLAVGKSILFIWFAYCITSITLAINRLLEFVHRPTSEFLFQGRRAWIWFFPAWVYSITMECTTTRPFYIYIPDKGEWSFYELSDDEQKLVENPNHITNNTMKSVVIASIYGLMLIILKIKLRRSGATMSQMEIMLSIQAFIIGMLSMLSSLGFVVLSYLPISNFLLIGPVEQFMWASVHGGSAYIYLFMNKSVRNTALAPFRTKKKTTVVKSIAGITISTVPLSSATASASAK